MERRKSSSIAFSNSSKSSSAPAPNDGTKLTFVHSGWGTGPEWDKAYDYFDNAWRTFVLPLLKHRVANGPIDWSKPPKVEPVAPTLKAER